MWNKKRVVILVLCSVLSCSTLTGCRESRVIENLVLNNITDEVRDYQMARSDEDAEIEEDTAAAKEESAEASDTDKDTETTSDPAEDAQASTPDSAPAPHPTEDNSQTANTGDSTGEGDRSGSQSVGNSDPGYGDTDTTNPAGDSESSDNHTGQTTDPGSEESDQSTTENPQTEEPDPEDPQTSDPGADEPDPEQEDPNSGNGTGRLEDDPDARQVYDSNNNLVYLPAQVNRIAAAGEAGLIVQMLGGADADGHSALCAGSASFLTENRFSRQVFADEGIADIPVLWDGDGRTPMSDSNFDWLINENRPDCVISISGQTNFSDSQLQALWDANIPVITIPDMNLAHNIKEAVLIVGETLGDRTVYEGDRETTSWNLAQDYVSYEQDMVAAVENTHGYYAYYDYNTDPRVDGLISANNPAVVGMSTIYIDDWDDAAYIDDTLCRQYGIAATTGGWWSRPISYYMAKAGVLNTAADEMRSLYYEELRTKKYLVAQDGPFWIEEHAFPGQRNLVTDKSIAPGRFLWYLGYEAGANFYPGWSDAFKEQHYENQFEYYLGGSFFRHLVTSTRSIAHKIEESKNREDGLYHVMASEAFHETIENYEDGVITRESLNVFHDYEIYTNPDGVGDWAEGSVESVLESIWISSIAYGNYSEAEVESYVRDFYQTFYREAINEQVITDILAGKP